MPAAAVWAMEFMARFKRTGHEHKPSWHLGQRRSLSYCVVVQPWMLSALGRLARSCSLEDPDAREARAEKKERRGFRDGMQPRHA